MNRIEEELIKKARKRIKEGKFLTESQARKRLGLADKLASKSKLTEKDAEEIGNKIKKGIAVKHGFAENDEIRIFKIEYSWCEGDYDKSLVGKNVSVKEFEKDLKEARNFAESLIGIEVERDYLGKGYAVECLPEFYRQIIWFLINKKGYLECEYNYLMSYDIDDSTRSGKIEIIINKVEKITEREEI